MSRRLEFIVLITVDIIAVASSCIVFLRLRFPENFHILGFTGVEGQTIYPLYASLALSIFWIIMLLFAGMYRERHAASRIDEIVSLAKVITVGVLILVFSIFIDTLETGGSLSTFSLYWASVLGIVVSGRIFVRSIQKALILRGYGTHRALVVGWREQVEKLYQDVAKYPAAGLQIVGAVRLRHQGEEPHNGSESENGEMVHAIERLPDMIDELQVRDVLIALGSQDHQELAEVLGLCDGKNVSLKIVPDFYSVIGGMARTEHIYGLPLIEVLSTPMPVWEQYTKRLMDLFCRNGHSGDWNATLDRNLYCCEDDLKGRRNLQAETGRKKRASIYNVQIQNDADRCRGRNRTDMGIQG